MEVSNMEDYQKEQVNERNSNVGKGKQKKPNTWKKKKQLKETKKREKPKEKFREIQERLLVRRLYS